MKNKLYILLVLLFAAAFYACADDKIPVDEPNEEESNRLFMPMLRQNANTAKGDSDPRRCHATGDYGNDIFISWYEVQGAAAYQVRMKIQSGSWDNPDQILLDKIVEPGTFEMLIEDLQYGVKHNFSIRALYTKTGYINDDPALGEHPWNSQWYGIGDAGHNDDRVEVETEERADVPEVMTKDGDIGYTTARITFNLNAADNTTENTTFETENGLYVIDQITIAPSDNSDLPSFTYDLTEQDKKNGYLDVDGLTSNAMYIVNGVNNNIERYWDRLYNTIMMRMKGDPGDPIVLTHIVDTLPAAIEHQASRIDTILSHYMSDNTLAEGTVFVLEAGKKYYMQNTLNISKGMVLKSADPNNPATVYLGLGYGTPGEPATGRTCNFSLGRNAQAGEMGSIDIQSIVFEDIHFEAPYALDYYEMIKYNSAASAGSGNYFINQSSSAMEFFCESLEVRNCTFQRMMRGWMRVQGISRKIIKNIIMDNCVHYNGGIYNSTGRGYPIITCSESNISPKTNVFQHVVISNSSFIGNSYDHFVNDPNNRAWPSNVSWDISLINNTFLNFNCMSNGRYYFNMRYNPSNSSFTVKNNLFILTKKEGDPRAFWTRGMNIRNTNGIQFDVANNWSTNTNLASSGQIFSQDPFSSTSQGAGFDNGAYNKEGLEATIVKADNISPTELMVDPNPLEIAGSNANPTPPSATSSAPWNTFRHKVPDGIYYQNTDAVRNSAIYKNNVGDPRWRKYVTP